MVHPDRDSFAGPASFDEAVKFFKFTLNRLLGLDLF